MNSCCGSGQWLLLVQKEDNLRDRRIGTCILTFTTSEGLAIKMPTADVIRAADIRADREAWSGFSAIWSRTYHQQTTLLHGPQALLNVV